MSTSKRSSRKHEHSPQAAGEFPRTGAIGNESVKAHEPNADADQRRQKIAVAAYFLAEKRGFCPGCELDDWLKAEAQINRQLDMKS